MAFSDNLIDLIKTLGGQNGGPLATAQAFSWGGPQGANDYMQQQQENQRQAAQLQQQLQLHNTMTPYERGMLGVAQQNADSKVDTQGKDLFDMISRGGKLVDAGTPGAIGYGDKFLLPPTPLQKPAPFTYRPTLDDIQDHPFLGQFAKDGITMDAKEFPGFMKDMGGLSKSNPRNAIEYENTLRSQLQQLSDPNDPEDKALMPTRMFQIHDALHPFDGSTPDFKRANGVLDDVRKTKEAGQAEAQRLAQQYSPAAIAGAASKSGAEKAAGNNADLAQSMKLIPDSAFLSMYNRIKSGQIPLDQAANQVGRMDKITRDRWVGFLGNMGDSAGVNDLPTPLDTDAKKRVTAIEPVMDEIKDMMAQVAPYRNDSTPMRTFASRLKYSVGFGDENSGLISQQEMMRIRGAAQAAGGAPALKIMDQAQLHTPSSWLSSGQQAYGQMQNMLDYLANQEHYIFKYGGKYGVAQTEENTNAVAPNTAQRNQGLPGGINRTTAPAATPSGAGRWDIVNGKLAFTPTK